MVMIWQSPWPCLVFLWLVAGCDPSDAGKGNTPVPTNQPVRVTEFGHLNQAQPKLPTLKLWLGAEELATELALTDVQRATGMMFRTNMAENEAMLFVFETPHQAAFYMKNTVIPLSLAYLDSKGTILEIHDLQPRDERAATANTDRVQYVLEVNQGWFKRHSVATGAVVRTERGSLPETFFRKR